MNFACSIVLLRTMIIFLYVDCVLVGAFRYGTFERSVL